MKNGLIPCGWRRLPHLLVIALTPILPAALCLPAPLRAAETVQASLADPERAIDKQHLLEIHKALQSYKQKHGELPNWLSDLVPEFLPDPKILMSPVELRTGRSVLWGYGDPRIKSSYIYEFNQSKAGGIRDTDIPLTMKQWKMQQMEEFGPVIPILRCHLHDPVLNLSFSGEVYETQLFWETDTNTLALMARLGPGPGASQGRRLTLSVLDAVSREPIEGAEVFMTNRQSEFGPIPPRRHTTDATGRCEVNLGGKNPKAAALEVTKPGFARARVEWGDGLEIPAAWSVELVEAGAIGGVVKNTNGTPISGASVTVSGLVKDAVGQVVPMPYDTVSTDAEGRWRSTKVPRQVENFTFKIGHPDYMPAEYDLAEETGAEGKFVTADALAAFKAPMTLEPGIAVRGSVVDDQGRPVAGARIGAVVRSEQAADLRNTTTDASGRYRFVLTEPAQVTVSVEAAGYAPRFRQVNAEFDMDPVAFALDHGRKLTGRVETATQQPLEGVSVSVGSWEGGSPLRWAASTDAEGRFKWENAPDGQVVVGFQKEGFTESYMQPPPGSDEWIVTLREPFKLSGKVLDAETGQPVPKFRIIRGFVYEGMPETGPGAVRWERFNTEDGVEGAYSITVDAGQGYSSVACAVRAEGYVPGVSPTFGLSGQKTHDFKLKRGIGPSGVVEGPAGQPLAGAQVVLLNSGENGYMSKPGEFGRGSAQGQQVDTSAQGRFQFEPDLAPKWIMAAHEAGYGFAPAEEFLAGGTLKLQPWGKVKGVVKCQGNQVKRFATLQPMNYMPGPGSAGRGDSETAPPMYFFLSQELDDQGGFCFERVPPGELKCYVRYQFDRAPGPVPLSHGVFVQVNAGQTQEVCLGGGGRRIVGKARVPEEKAGDVNWLKGMSVLAPLRVTGLEQDAPDPRNFATNEESKRAFQEYQERLREFYASPAGKERQRNQTDYILLFDETGSFFVDGIPPGSYTLSISPGSNKETAETAFRRRYGMPGGSGLQLTKQITIPEPDPNSPNTPFDLGTLDLR